VRFIAPIIRECAARLVSRRSGTCIARPQAFEVAAATDREWWDSVSPIKSGTHQGSVQYACWFRRSDMGKLSNLFRKWWGMRGAADTEPASKRTPRDLWSAADWARVRAPVRHRDQELSRKSLSWLATLPPEVRPRELCSHYPRIANRLAVCWRDIGLIDHLLDELLVDRRHDRQGFPPTVLHEITRLYDFHAQRLHIEEDTGTDDPSTQTR